jgi:DNA-binding CsgD family transcriptional regulator
VLDLLAGLADKSLVVAEEQPDGTARYRLLETLREYARERLAAAGATEAVARRHAEHFVALAEAAEAAWIGGRRSAAVARLGAEHDNLRAVLDWGGARGSGGPPAGRDGGGEHEGGAGRDDRGALGLRLAGMLWWFWRFTGSWTEGRRRLGAALALAGGAAAGGDRIGWRAKALCGAGALAGVVGEAGEARRLLEESVALARGRGDRRQLAIALQELGYVAQAKGEYATSRALQAVAAALFRAQGDKALLAMSLNITGMAAIGQGDAAAAGAALGEAIALFREVGDPWGAAVAEGSAGYLAYLRGDYATARTRLEAALARRREAGEQQGALVMLNRLAQVARAAGDAPRAAALGAEALALARDHDDRGNAAWALQGLAQAALARGAPRLAAAHLDESLRLYLALDDRRGVTQDLAAAGGVAAATDRPERAARLLGAAEASLERIGVALTPADRMAFERDLAAARAGLDGTAFAAARAAGRRLPLGAAVAEAWAVLAPPVGAASAPAGPAAGPAGASAGRRLPGGLTAREAEVLRHVAAGETDRQIAAALVVTEATVGRHLANVYAKLGVASRAATAFALRAGLA